MKLVDEEAARRNILYYFSKVDEIDFKEGCSAYENYNRVIEEISCLYGFHFNLVAAVFCATSPNNDYYGNLRSTITILHHTNIRTPINKIVISTYNHCKERAIRYLNGDEEFDVDKRGMKIRSFYHNIITPKSPYWITIDGHMIAIYQGDSKMTMKQAASLSKNQYKKISKLFLEVAKEKGLVPNQLQAMLWFTRKRLYNIVYNPAYDMFSCEDDHWKILQPIELIKPYDSKNI